MSSISVCLRASASSEHRRVVRGPTPGCEDVHLPRVVVQLDTGGLGDRLPLVDELVDEMTEVRGLVLLGEVEVVSQAR